nr:SEL1-like repeat protein [Nocardiopsis alba]
MSGHDRCPKGAESSYATNTGVGTHDLPLDADGAGRVSGVARSPGVLSVLGSVVAVVDNRTRDNHGVSIQARDINGPITVHPRTDASVPGWVDTALPVHRCDVGELGVHNALPGDEGEGLPPYVARDVDEEIDRRLAAVSEAPRGGLVLVTGASTSGKTRALVEALGRTLPDRMLVAPPEGADLRALPAWLGERAESAPQGWVVWLDDLERHLGSSGLTPTLVAELGLAGAVVAATIRRNHLEALRPSPTDRAFTAEGVGYAVLKTPPVVVERRWNPQERDRARASGDERLVQAADDERFGVAEQLAAGPLLQQAWNGGPDGGHARGYALVAAAVGLAEAGVSSPLTREQIQAVHVAYLPAPPPLPEEDDQAWEWATCPRSGMAGLLVPADHEGRRWRAFDYLTHQGPLPEAVWRTALETTTGQERLDVGLTAHSADLYDVAEAAWTPLAEQGYNAAMVDLGLLLEEVGRVGEAEAWLRRAAGKGEINAMHAFGILLYRSGRLEEAEPWYRRAAEGGLAGAMFNFGLLLQEVGRLEEAESWYRRAADVDEIDAMGNLAILLSRSGRFGEAESWYRRAAEKGRSDAMFNLGLLLKGLGRDGEAEAWFRWAAEEGEVKAMNNLGLMLEEAGRIGEAEAWYRRAVDGGDTEAVFNLGLLMHREGRSKGAEEWYRRAAAEGDPGAMSNLGVLLNDAGRVEEAVSWFRQAAEAGHPGAAHNLAVLLGEAGRGREAEAW